MVWWLTLDTYLRAPLLRLVHDAKLMVSCFELTFNQEQSVLIYGIFDTSRYI